MSKPIALITGGSRGLGKNTALHLARQGVDVIITYHSQAAEAEKVVAELKSLGSTAASLQLDAGDIGSFGEFTQNLQHLLQRHWQCGQFNFLINNAGMGIHAGFAETTEAQFDQLMNVHVKGVFFLTQALLPLLQDGGSIINVSSGLTRFAIPGYAAYAAMKGAVEILTHYQAKELGGRGIRVNTIAPGAIETDFGGGAVRDNQNLNAFLASQTALGRVGQPDDIGGAIAAMLADGNRWMTAQRVEVSGGMFL